MNFFAYLASFGRGEYTTDHLCGVSRQVTESGKTTEVEKESAYALLPLYQAGNGWDEEIREKRLRELASALSKRRYHSLLTLEKDLRVLLLGLDRESRVPYQELQEKTRQELRLLSKLLYSRV